MRLFLIILALLFLVPTSLFAGDDYVLGAKGYYWKNGTAYIRTKVSSGYWYNNGCYSCYQPTYYYSYAPVIDIKAPDFWDRIGDAIKSEKENAARLEAMELLGYQKKAPLPAPTPAFGHAGPTQYGYDYRQIAELYGTTDQNLMFQLYMQNASRRSDQSSTDMVNAGSLIGQVNDAASRIAEIRAKMQGDVDLVRALRPSKVETIIKGTGKGLNGNVNPSLPLPRAEVPVTFEGVVNNRCVKCHSGDKIEGGFDVTKYWTLTAEKRMEVMDRLLSEDPDYRMPKGGDPLNAVQVKAFIKKELTKKGN